MHFNDPFYTSLTFYLDHLFRFFILLLGNVAFIKTLFSNLSFPDEGQQRIWRRQKLLLRIYQIARLDSHLEAAGPKKTGFHSSSARSRDRPIVLEKWDKKQYRFKNKFWLPEARGLAWGHGSPMKFRWRALFICCWYDFAFLNFFLTTTVTDELVSI